MTTARITHHGLVVCDPDWLALDGLMHGVTTRSALPEPGKPALIDAVETLRDKDTLPDWPLVGAEQVHGDAIAVIDWPFKGLQRFHNVTFDATRKIAEFTATDALVSTQPHVLLVVQTADCLPVFAFDAERRICGLAHCGWRGLAAELAGKFAHRLLETGAHVDSLRVWLGPCIRPDHYEVDAELIERFKRLHPGAMVSYDGRHLDLAAVARWQLEQAGVLAANIADSELCTFDDDEAFHSYRRDGDDAGRLLSYIGFAK